MRPLNSSILSSLTNGACYVQVSQIEFSLVEKDIIFGLKQGNEALAEIHKEMNIESVEKLMEETAEGIAYQRVRRCLMSSPSKGADVPDSIIGDRRIDAKQDDSRRGRRGTNRARCSSSRNTRGTFSAICITRYT